MSEQELPTYWRPEPQLNDWMFISLIITCGIYVFGVILYGAQAMVATNGQSGLAQQLGSTLMVVGGESSTLFSVMEVFRKARTPKETHKEKDEDGNVRTIVDSYEDTAWDWSGILVSLFATLGTLFVIFTRQTGIDAEWVRWTIKYGPLILLLCSGLDQYAASMELGFLRASFSERWEEWNDAKHSWIRTELARRDRLERERREHEVQMLSVEHEIRDESGAKVEENEPDLYDSHTELADESSDLPRMHVSAWDAYVNGQGRGRPDVRAIVNADNGEQVEMVNRLLKDLGWGPLPASTARDWARRIKAT